MYEYLDFTFNYDCLFNVCVIEVVRVFEMVINIYIDMVREIDYIKNMLNFLVKL